MNLPKGVEPDDIYKGVWRVDIYNGWPVAHNRMVCCVYDFAAQQSWPLQRLIVNDPGEEELRTRVNAIGESATGLRQALRRRVDAVCGRLRCNESQKDAVLKCVDYKLRLVQGPPGTGKTQVAAALVRTFKAVSYTHLTLPTILLV